MELYKPDLKDLWFREKFMNDPDTMSFPTLWDEWNPCQVYIMAIS